MLSSDPPGAEVLEENGEVLGTTPLTLHSPPHADRVRLELRLARYRTAKVDAAFPERGQPGETPVELKPLPTLKLESTPAGARVSLKGGDELGATPYEWLVPEAVFDRLEAGQEVKLAFELDGRRPTERAVTAAALARDEPLVAELEPAARRAGKARRVRKPRPRPKTVKPIRPKTGAWSID